METVSGAGGVHLVAEHQPVVSRHAGEDGQRGLLRRLGARGGLHPFPDRGGRRAGRRRGQADVLVPEFVAEGERQSVQRETTDYLTGLYNRRKLFEYLGEKEKKGSAEPLAGILMLDIDFFKLYNDSYGHIAGDECLRRIGAYLLSLGQSYPVSFFRYGGEEFLGTSSNFNREELCCFGEKIVDELRGLNIQNEFVERGRVTVSVGLAFSDSPDGRSYEQLISQADSALYEAKRTGRNRAVVWHPGMSTIEQSCR